MSGKATLWCGLLLAAMTMVSAQTNQQQPNQQNSQCLQTFSTQIQQCFTTSQSSWPNFLFIISNGTRGSNPGTIDNFKTPTCPKQRELFTCGIEFMKKLINSSVCLSQGNDQRENLDFQFRSLFATLDDICAHPCRRTLNEDLRQCYLDANLDADLFLSNSSMGRGAVIGVTKGQANSFCTNKDTLITCMKARRDDCPDAPMILRAIGLDIESLDVGVSVLCKHQKVYLNGVDCFAEPTEAVIKCQREVAQNSIQLMMKAQQTNMEQDELFDNLCDVRLKHVNCDLAAWAKKDHKSCNPVVIGLRTELECSLLPDECEKAHKVVIDKVCHPDKFKKKERLINSAPTVMATALVIIASALVSLL